MSALACQHYAVTARAARRDLKTAITSRKQPIGLVLMNPPDYALRMRLGDVLCAAPYIGRVKTNRICERVGISPLRLLCELSLADRRRLILALPNSQLRFSVRNMDA
jgi:hypothetical protein